MWVIRLKIDAVGVMREIFNRLKKMQLHDALKGILTKKELMLLVRGYDIVGDIAITIIDPCLEAKEKIIGEMILKLHKNIRVVAKRSGNYRGEFRTIALKIIAGENRLETLHCEHGVRLFLNPAKVYFSIRSSHERKRLARLVNPGEDVLVMFSGVGVYPLVLARNSSACLITGVEKNPTAHEYAVKNLVANKKIQNIIFQQGDVVEVVPQLKNKFDRVIMPLPGSGEDFLDIGLTALKRGGSLHFYDFQKTDYYQESVRKVESACLRNGLSCMLNKVVTCGHSAPRTYRICVDAIIN